MAAFTKAALIGAVAALPVLAQAAGFSLTEQSVTGLGRSFAGGAAMAEDASTLYYNPAGITRLKEEIVTGASLIKLTADYDKTTATDAIGQPLSGGEGGDVGKLGGPATFYYVRPIDETSAWGVGVNFPFGLATDYDRDWVGRYQTVYTNVAIMNIQPTYAKRWDKLSVGFGLDVQYMTVKLQNEIDFGAVCFGQVGPVTCTSLGLTPQAADGAVTLTGDSIGYGFNWGVLYDNDGTRLGITYRSRVEHSLDGTADFNRVPAIFTGLGVFVDTGIKAGFTAPEILSFGFVSEVNDQWMVSVDVTRTGWDTFQDLTIKFDNPAQPDSTEYQGYQDVYKMSVGVDYKWNSAWTFRAGIGYDNSPVQDQFRTARLPDGDRNWLSVGATWHLSDMLDINAGFAYLQLNGGDNLPIDHTGATADNISGTYTGDATIAGVEARIKF